MKLPNVKFILEKAKEQDLLLLMYAGQLRKLKNTKKKSIYASPIVERSSTVLMISSCGMSLRKQESQTISFSSFKNYTQDRKPQSGQTMLQTDQEVKQWCIKVSDYLFKLNAEYVLWEAGLQDKGVL